jgi:hypothetical protein
MSSEFRVMVASSPDWTSVSAQVWCGEHRVCDVRDQSGKLFVTIFPNPEEPVWNLDHRDFLAALEKAKQMLGG